MSGSVRGQYRWFQSGSSTLFRCIIPSRHPHRRRRGGRYDSVCDVLSRLESPRRVSWGSTRVGGAYVCRGVLRVSGGLYMCGEFYACRRGPLFVPGGSIRVGGGFTRVGGDDLRALWGGPNACRGRSTRVGGAIYPCRGGSTCVVGVYARRGDSTRTGGVPTRVGDL